MISHMPWNRREEKLNSFNFFSSQYYITKINSCYSNNILDRKKILSCQNASNGIFWAWRFHFFFWGRMPPEIPSDSHLWNKNDFEAIQKHPEFTSSNGWTVWENLLKDQNIFLFDHFFYSHNLTFWLCMDIVRRK